MADHIKKCFSGDEKIMMLQTYYRYMNYSPITSLSSSVSLILQIPFFIAAYQVLASSLALKGVSLGPISDLGSADSIIHIGRFSVNILPIIMTLINIVSSYIYSKNLDKKSKFQLYLTASVFLVLLYNSPSGLVVYWTFNNVFSLIKNIVTKLLPNKKAHTAKTIIKDKNDTVIFLLYSFCLSIFIGLLIPSDMFSRSVGDFLTNFKSINIFYYLWVSFFISLGVFVVWGSIYFFVMKNRKAVAGVMVSLTAFSLLNYFAFYRNNGDMNRYLYIKTYFDDNLTDGIFNVVILILSAMLIFIVMKNKPVIFKYIAILALAAITVVSFINIKKIYDNYSSYSFIENQREYPVLTLSADKPNVVVIMLDRAVGRLTPFIMNEIPELQEQFDGFTYYNNSLSFGLHTNMGAPALFGGYEYTPASMNQRAEESLENKHNEALCVLPVLFGENDYNVTVMDPPYAGYTEIPDLSIYNDYPYINSYITQGIMNPLFDDMTDDWSNFMERNLFSYSLRTASPILIRRLLYDDGFFNELNRRLSNDSYFQSVTDTSHATGLDYDFINSYYALNGLSSITDIESEDNAGSFVMLVNDTTHEPALLEEPSYDISRIIDNSGYDTANTARFVLDNMTLHPDSPEMMGQYQIQAAAFVQLGNWFDYLREQGVYDNTRIIIVSDHGAPFYLFGIDDTIDSRLNICNFNCLMMVKDFGSSGFTVSDEFIINAETPLIAVDGLFENPVNPFTGNAMVSQLYHPQDFLYFSSPLHNPSQNNGNTYMPGDWFTYDPSSGDIYDQSAWEYFGEG